MKKRVQKHIDKQEYVKIYISDTDGSHITHFNGFIFEQNSKFLFLSETHDFMYDGAVVLRKKDISEIKRTENEKFIQKILEKEGLKKAFYERYQQLDFHLDSFENMFRNIQKKQIPITLEARYGKDDRFLIGPVAACTDKQVKINYFNSYGEFDLKLVPCKYKEITHFSLDSPYANLFYKYVKKVK